MKRNTEFEWFVMKNQIYTYTTLSLKGHAQAKIIKKIGDFILASEYDHMM